MTLNRLPVDFSVGGRDLAFPRSRRNAVKVGPCCKAMCVWTRGEKVQQKKAVNFSQKTHRQMSWALASTLRSMACAFRMGSGFIKEFEGGQFWQPISDNGFPYTSELLEAPSRIPYEPLSKLLVSPLITPIVIPYIIPHIFPLIYGIPSGFLKFRFWGLAFKV